MPGWIDFGHPTTWVMGFNEFNNFFYFCKLFLFNFMITLDVFKIELQL
jgi:hypothetical protein